ncbi:hypothetical protein [Niveispirillum sp. KHB5.9]|uniref:hypothetical protein n=1 Tax=Niveispirillum sp. KHB5.9 TaxID=3400269 RepID=UPI003A887F49
MARKGTEEEGMDLQGRVVISGGGSGLGAATAPARHIVGNAMLNGETIRLDGALRTPSK